MIFDSDWGRIGKQVTIFGSDGGRIGKLLTIFDSDPRRIEKPYTFFDFYRGKNAKTATICSFEGVGLEKQLHFLVSTHSLLHIQLPGWPFRHRLHSYIWVAASPFFAFNFRNQYPCALLYI